MSEVQPDLHVGPSTEPAQPVGPAPESALVGQVPAPKAATLEKLNTRVNADFRYWPVTGCVEKVLDAAGVPAGTIQGDERQVSLLRFEDEPLRNALDRLAHMVSGTWDVNDAGAVDFTAGA